MSNQSLDSFWDCPLAARFMRGMTRIPFHSLLLDSSAWSPFSVSPLHILANAPCLTLMIVYESFRDLKEPLIPMHLFKDIGYTASMISLALGASVYYSQAIIWPQLVGNVYSNGRLMWGGWVSCLVGIGITVGVDTHLRLMQT